MMAGFPELPLPNGKVVPAETDEERASTRDFALELRQAGAIDIVGVSMVIPLPGTDMWEALSIGQKMQVLLNRVPDSAPESAAIHAIERAILEQFPDENRTRYQEEPEKRFWEAVYRLPWSAQVLIMQSYDAFNADAAQTIKMERPDAEALWLYRENIVNEFYGGLGMKAKMVTHVVRRSSSLHDFAAYMTLMGRKFDPATKTRPGTATPAAALSPA